MTAKPVDETQFKAEISAARTEGRAPDFSDGNTILPAKLKADIALEWLRQYPAIRDCQPLAIGFDKGLIQTTPIWLPGLWVRLVIGRHVNCARYLKSIIASNTRFNLDGTASDPIAPEHKARAEHQLAERKQRQKRRNKAAKAKQNKTPPKPKPVLKLKAPAKRKREKPSEARRLSAPV